MFRRRSISLPFSISMFSATSAGRVAWRFDSLMSTLITFPGKSRSTSNSVRFTLQLFSMIGRQTPERRQTGMNERALERAGPCVLDRSPDQGRGVPRYHLPGSARRRGLAPERFLLGREPHRRTWSRVSVSPEESARHGGRSQARAWGGNASRVHPDVVPGAGRRAGRRRLDPARSHPDGHGGLRGVDPRSPFPRRARCRSLRERTVKPRPSCRARWVGPT